VGHTKMQWGRIGQWAVIYGALNVSQHIFLYLYGLTHSWILTQS
jgi:hypothetical protein